LGKHHETAKSNRKQNWLRTSGARFDMQILEIKIEANHEHIQDVEERERIISQE
jgi:hypothetical protein